MAGIALVIALATLLGLLRLWLRVLAIDSDLEQERERQRIAKENANALARRTLRDSI